jgi:miniconductance mechanosensitive channel
MKTIIENIGQWAVENPLLWQITAVVGVLILAALAYFITHRYILNLISKVVKKSQTDIDDILFDNKLMRQASFLPPLLIIYYLGYLTPNLEEIIHRISIAMMSILALIVCGSLLTKLNLFYDKTNTSRNKPIKSYIQVVKLIFYILGGIIILATLIGQSPWFFVTGLGAMTAVLILVFRDTILSFVASLQITGNDLVRVGDWIDVPSFSADGDVMDIALHTIKVQNWDKTITVIPTHKLIDVSFKNWRGMQVTGGRRIKRSIFVDQNSIKICDDKLLAHFKSIELIKDYLEDKTVELKEYNKTNQISDDSRLVNSRRMTNIGTFRIYVELYLKQHEKIHHGLTTMARQLSPGAHGLPIEIYTFTNTTAWLEYESIQADIFDHILAVIPEFELKIFQNPSGLDFQNIAGLQR